MHPGKVTPSVRLSAALVGLALGVLACAPGEPEVRVLFLGNSYTHTNDLPGTVVELAESAGVDVVAESHAPGGWWLQDHASSDDTLALLGDEWDYVVLQEQSMVPAVRALSRESMQPAAIALSNRAAGARLVLFETWGHRSGSAEVGLADYGHMQAAITATYRELADTINAEVAPVGSAWSDVREQHPEISLYHPDGSHPSANGTYLAAVVITSLILDSEATDLATVGIDDETARNLRATAARVQAG